MIKEKAYAKINLFLSVVGKRLDGFHDLEMVMAPLKIHDTLKFKKTTEPEIKIVSSTDLGIKLEENIIYKVAKSLQDEFHVQEGVTIYLDKIIPLGGGLGGGSADAAATFRGLNKLWKLNLTLEDMTKLGEEFGSDIPFCIYNKLALVKGKGEKLTFFNTKLKMNVLLVYPKINVSTQKVFTNYDLEKHSGKSITDFTLGIHHNNYEKIRQELFNSLEQVTFEMYPEIKEVKHHMINNGITASLMSGSGATVFGLSRDKKKLAKYNDALNKRYITFLTKVK